MFERFIRLARAKKALRDRCFEDALALATDPLIQSDRRAEAIRREATDGLLGRVRRNIANGELVAARAEVARVRGLLHSPEAEELAAQIEAATAVNHAAADLSRRTLAEVRKLLGRGEAAAASALLATVPPAHLLLERDQLQHLLTERRRQAAELCATTLEAVRAGQLLAGIDGLFRAQAIDRDAPETVSLQSEVLKLAAAQVGDEVRSNLDRQDPGAALDCYRSAMQQLPPLAQEHVMVPLRRALAAAVRLRLQRVGAIDEALGLATAVITADLHEDADLMSLCAAIQHAANRNGRGECGPAAEHLHKAASVVGAEGLVAAAVHLAAGASAQDQRMAAVHDLIDTGNLDGARTALVQMLTAEPRNEAARRELELVQQGLAELDKRLEDVRAAARAGRLREACAAALALKGSARVAVEAQLLVSELRSRMSVVDRGLDEVRVALHGRLAAGIEGVRHCLRRLEELAKVQVDHEGLAAVQAAVTAEIAALEFCEAAVAAVERRAFEDALPAVLGLLPLCDQLIARDRLEARICALADRVRACGEGGLSCGRLTEVDRCAELLEQLQSIRSEFGQRAASLRLATEQRREAATGLVGRAKECLERRDLAEAERLAEEAQGQWSESPDLRQLVAQLADLRRQTEALGRVEVLTKERDFLGAHQKLASMPPTQALLRTRIYDMKQNLARAQGLEGAFLLRVDEGGEQLVMRGESVSIGNVRQTRADLPVLANLAGRHASIRRAMSFHGGMQDTVVAEEGDVRVGGVTVTSRSLVPGDRVQLGSALAFLYHRPSARSLSASLLLQGGFQVAGTDRIVLMKDRGRDGRILLGPGKDVHVRVPNATGEVEIFATNAGQVRVHCDVGGTIDGVPFRGEHPVAASQVVVAAGVSFLMLPWRPAS